MAGKGKGFRPVGERFDRKISAIKYTVICFIIICLALALSIFALTIWLLVDPDFQQWIKMMDIEEFYIGVYILLIASLFVMAMVIFGCIGLFSENVKFLYVFIGLQVFCFVALVVGSAVLLNYGTRNSAIQPLMRNSIRRLIMDSYNPQSVEKLRVIQETIGCCGADGANDYINLKKPLPSECRDTVTGSAYYYGCVETFTLFLEDKAGWIAGLSMLVCLIAAVDVVLTIIMIKMLKREEKALRPYDDQ